MVIASRGLPDADIQVHQPKRRELMGRTYNVLLRLLVLPDIHDSQCGLKVFTATAALTCFTPLRTMRFGFDAEVLVRARRQGWTIAEVPVRWRHVEASRVSAGSDAARMLYRPAAAAVRPAGDEELCRWRRRRWPPSREPPWRPSRSAPPSPSRPRRPG